MAKKEENKEKIEKLETELKKKTTKKIEEVATEKETVIFLT